MNLIEIIGWPLGWVMWLFYQLGNNYVLSLLLFTIAIRLILLPSSVKQQKNTAKMRVFQPKIEKIQKKYGKDQKKVQEETMKLYEEEGYNPMGGCFPLLIQLPIIYGLMDVVYRPINYLLRLPAEAAAAVNQVLTEIGNGNRASEISLISDIAAGKTHGLSADIVAQIKTLDLNFFGLNLGEVPSWSTALIIIPILSGISSFAVSWFTTKLSQQSNPAMKQTGGMMKGMMIIMPLMSFFIAFSVPAGVGLYWILSNIIMGVQSFALNKYYNPGRIEAIVEKEREEIRTGKRKKKQGFMQKMQKAAQEQQQAQSGKPGPKLTEEDAKREKEQNRIKIAEARKRMAEKYGDVYDETNEND